MYKKVSKMRSYILHMYIQLIKGECSRSYFVHYKRGTKRRVFRRTRFDFTFSSPSRSFDLQLVFRI